jgi:phage terminase large subunit
LALQTYRREWDEATRTFKPKPLHDWSSHGADALRTFAMGFGDDSAATAPPAYERTRRAGGGTWMAA